jgi:hypothetical protein
LKTKNKYRFRILLTFYILSAFYDILKPRRNFYTLLHLNIENILKALSVIFATKSGFETKSLNVIA